MKYAELMHGIARQASEIIQVIKDEEREHQTLLERRRIDTFTASVVDYLFDHYQEAALSAATSGEYFFMIDFETAGANFCREDFQRMLDGPHEMLDKFFFKLRDEGFQNVSFSTFYNESDDIQAVFRAEF